LRVANELSKRRTGKTSRRGESDAPNGAGSDDPRRDVVAAVLERWDELSEAFKEALADCASNALSG
jgi:hypothetical protein